MIWWAGDGYMTFKGCFSKAPEPVLTNVRDYSFWQVRITGFRFVE